MTRSAYIVPAVLALLAAACSDSSPLLPPAAEVVIRGYLYAGEPVTEIRVTSALSLGSEDTVAPPISDARVTLTKNGTRYELIPTPNRPGFYNYPGTDLSVEAGNQFGLEVNYYGKVATAITNVPPQPQQLDIYPQQLVVVSIGSGGFGEFRRFFEDDTTAVRVDWSNPEGASFYVTLENLETDPQPINANILDNFPINFDGDLGRGFMSRFISVPVSGEEYRITRQNVTYLGRHLVKVYRVNQEYVDLYRSRSQDTRDLNEPLSNVEDGLGIFTAFNSDSVYLEVVQGE